MNNTTQPRLLRLPEVMTQVGLSRSQIYKLIQRGAFPSQIKVCQRIAVWSSLDIGSWIEQRLLECPLVEPEDHRLTPQPTQPNPINPRRPAMKGQIACSRIDAPKQQDKIGVQG